MAVIRNPQGRHRISCQLKICMPTTASCQWHIRTMPHTAWAAQLASGEIHMMGLGMKWASSSSMLPTISSTCSRHCQRTSLYKPLASRAGWAGRCPVARAGRPK